jgi:hypothetical protein
MKARKLLMVLAVVGSLILAGCAPTGPTQDVPTAALTNSLNKDPQNTTYLLDGQAITLVNGVAEVEAAPGSASKQVIRCFGNAVDIDLNGDGAMDQAFLLVQDSGGSGTFYFVVAALNTPDGYVGTNAIFIGDRIAPQNTVVDPNNLTQFIVNYADRKADEPMSAQPSQGVSKWFKLEGDVLVEVVSPTQTR